MSDTPEKKNEYGWIKWIVMIALFCAGVWPLALIVLAVNIFWNKRNRTSRVQPRHPYDIQQEQARRAAAGEQGPAAGAQQANAEAQSTSESAKAERPAAERKTPRGRAARKPKKTYTVMAVSGAIAAGAFLLGLIDELTTQIELASYGYGLYDNLNNILACALFLACGVGLLVAGLRGVRRQKRLEAYLAYIGDSRQVELAHMAAAFGISVSKLCKHLRRLWSAGLLPQGYLDLASGQLILGEGAPPPKAEPEPQDDRAILVEIRQVNDAISDPVMTAQISRIEEITGRILDYQQRNPDKAGRLRSFLSYYLPTTLKILRAYAQLDAQGVEGENISAAKARIEGMMDKVVEGFEAQLDRLFQDSAMDIAADVAVLEKMLEKDGLSGASQGLTL